MVILLFFASIVGGSTICKSICGCNATLCAVARSRAVCVMPDEAPPPSDPGSLCSEAGPDSCSSRGRSGGAIGQSCSVAMFLSE